jgi:protein CpxP
MKNAITILLLVLGITTMAQERKQQREKLTAEQKTELQVKQMTLDLDLNEKQQKAMKVLLLEQTKKREAKMEVLKKKKESGEKMTAEEKFELKNEQLDNRIAMKEEFKKILTAEQMEKLELNNERRQEKMQQKKEKRQLKKRKAD